MDVSKKINQLREKLRHLESLREVLGDELTDQKKTELEARLNSFLDTGGGAVTTGDVNAGRDVIGRDRIDITIQNGVYLGKRPEDDRRAEIIYRQVIADRCGQLPLRGVAPAPGEAATRQRPLSLARVYIGLDTTRTVSDKRIVEALQQAGRGEIVGLTYIMASEKSVREEDSRPLSALEAMILHRHWVLLGDPGSGKSTFVNYLTQALACQDWDHVPGWPEGERDALPIPVVLRDFAHWLAAQPDGSTMPCPDCLWRFIRHDLENRRLDFTAPLLEQALEDGRAVVLLDGLDEVPPENEKVLALTKDSVTTFIERYRLSRHLLTCRVLSYQEPRWRLTGNFAGFELAPFDEPKIDGFIGAWYGEVGDKWRLPPEEITRLADKLCQAVRRPDLWRLAPNPLLLTVMALVHTHRKELPEKRALLYQDAVTLLLEHWESHKEMEIPQLQERLREVQRDFNDLKGVLERLAFEALSQRGGTEEGTGIDELTLLQGMATLHPKQDYGWAQRLLETLRLRASLLLERQGRVFSFPHRTFQEYLAGIHLTHQPNFGERAGRLAGAGAFWREVILLAVGYLVHHQREQEKPRLLVEALCPDREPQDDQDWRKVWLAGEVLLEIGVNRVRDSEHGQRLLNRVRSYLTRLVEAGKLPARERAEAGDVLGQLGDSRFDPEFFFLPRLHREAPEPWAGFIEVTPGPFVMGDEKSKVSIDYPYWIARYPVTVPQYAAFVEVGGVAPHHWDAQKRFPNRPVVEVSWYNAMAYCRWLDKALRQSEKGIRLLPEGYIVRLPTEAEWEKAARGGDARGYAWGDDDWEEERANISDSEIDHPTCVGMYPLGATDTSFSALHDFSGNVWEWSLSLYKDYPYDPEDGRNDPKAEGNRVLRGGSWSYDRRYARCASRVRALPGRFVVVDGFRVVLSLADSEF